MKKLLLGLMVIFASVGFAQDLEQNLLLHYQFQNNFIDASSNGFDGIPNAILFEDDQDMIPLQAAGFNGSFSYVDFPNDDLLKPDLPITFSVTIRFDDISASSAIVVTNNYGVDVHTGVWMNISTSGKIAVNYGSGGTTVSSNRRTKQGNTNLAVGQWYNITGIVRGSNDMDIYIDCINDGGTYSGSGGNLFYTSDQGSIGRKDQGGVPPYYFNGAISDFRYWDRALTEEEIQLLCLDFELEVVSSSDPLCANEDSGVIEVIANDGIEPIEYLLNGGSPQDTGVFTGLSSGLYIITAIDANGNTVEVEVELEDPAELLIDFVDEQNPTCLGNSDGVVNVVGAGGVSANGTYTYYILGGQTQSDGVFDNLSSGDYTIIVEDDNGCTASIEAVLNDPLPIGIRTEVVPVSCESLDNGSITIMASGGSPDYTYSIDGIDFIFENTFTELASGSYLISVMDANGCITESTVTIETEEPFNFIVINVEPVTCVGAADGSVSVLASGTMGVAVYSIDGDNFTTNNVFENLTEGVYQIFASDDTGCEQVVEVTVGEGDEFSFSIDVIEFLCNGQDSGAIEIDVSGNDVYTFSIDGINYQSSSMFVNLTAGLYNVSVQNFLGCVLEDQVILSEPTELLTLPEIISTPSCFGSNDASVLISTSGGAVPYTYTLGGLTQSDSMFLNLGADSYDYQVEDANGCISYGTLIISNPDEIILTLINIVNAGCDGEASGSVTLEANTSDIIYSLNGVENETGEFVGLAGGSYIGIATNAMGCEVDLPFSINEESSIEVIQISSLPISCFGFNDGSISVLASGGTGNLIYALDGGVSQSNGQFDNLSPATYTVTIIDDANCTTSVIVNVPAASELELSIVDVINADCSNSGLGSFTIETTGGLPDYSYSVNGMSSESMVQNIPSGNHLVEVVDANGCQSDTSIIIDNVGNINIDSSAVNNVSCNNGSDGSINLFTDQPGIIYTLNGVSNSSGLFNDLSAGEYIVNLTNEEHCTAQYEFIVEQPEPLIISVDDIAIGSQGDRYIIVSAIGGNDPYRYSIDMGQTLQNDSIFSDLTEDTYHIWVIDSEGCMDSITVTLTDLQDISFGLVDIKVFPNPAKEDLLIELNIEELKPLDISFFDVTGIQVLNMKLLDLSLGKNIIRLPVDDLAAGVYLLQLNSVNAQYSERVIIVD